MRFIELGHFYANKEVPPGALDYLKNFRFDDSDLLTFFIDDYTYKTKKIDLDKLHEMARGYLPRRAYIYYESKIVEFADKTMEYLRKNFDVKDNCCRQWCSKVSDYLPDKITYSYINQPGFYANIYKKGRPNCFLLSLTWTLYRAGFFSGETNEVLTIIDKKYQKLEEKVAKLLPKDVRDRCRWVFVEA
jgi:hypothetical protein